MPGIVGIVRLGSGLLVASLPPPYVFGPFGIVADGDSLTLGYLLANADNRYSNVGSAELPAFYGVTSNIAIGGQTFATMLTNEAANVYPLFTKGSNAGYQNVASAFGGTNDIYAGTSAASLLTTAQTYFSNALANGATYCIYETVLPRAAWNAGSDAVRTSYNTSLRSAYAGSTTVFGADFASDPSIGNIAATGNAALFNADGIHLTVTGDQIAADYWACTLLQLGGKSRVTVTAISPSSGTHSGGTPVTLTGTGFLNATAAGSVVCVGGLRPSSFTVASDTSITCTTPAGYYAGAGDVMVNTPNGSGRLVAGYTWT